MKHPEDSFHRWHYASGSRNDHLLPYCNGIPLQEFNRLYLRISNTVAYRDPENGSLAIGQRQLYMPHKRLWSKFKVPVLFHRCLDDQLRSASFDLHQPKLGILFTSHTFMAYDKWEWKIDHWLIKSTQHSLPSLQWPSTIVCRPGK